MKKLSAHHITNFLLPCLFFSVATGFLSAVITTLFKMAAEMTGGHLEIESEVGVGTKVRAFFRTDHLDFVPVGDMLIHCDECHHG